MIKSYSLTANSACYEFPSSEYFHLPRIHLSINNTTYKFYTDFTNMSSTVKNNLSIMTKYYINI